MSFSASILILSCFMPIGPSFSPPAFIVPSLPVQDYILSEGNRMFDCVRALHSSMCQTNYFNKNWNLSGSDFCSDCEKKRRVH